MKEKTRSLRVWPKLLAAALGAGGVLLAHPLDHPKRDELRISKARIELVIDEEIAPGSPAQMIRALFDRDRDGRLDESEQAALLEHLAKTAELHQHLEVDGVPALFSREPGQLRGEHLAGESSSTALLAVRMVLSAPWPAGSGDWRGRRKLKFIDDAPDATGHVPVQVFCAACEIVDSSAGTFAHDPKGDWVLGAEVSPMLPLELKIKL